MENITESAISGDIEKLDDAADQTETNELQEAKFEYEEDEIQRILVEHKKSMGIVNRMMQKRYDELESKYDEVRFVNMRLMSIWEEKYKDSAYRTPQSDLLLEIINLKEQLRRSRGNFEGTEKAMYARLHQEHHLLKREYAELQYKYDELRVEIAELKSEQ